VLLKPGQTRTEYWLFRLEPGQDRRYIYNFTTRAYTTRNASSMANLISSREYKVYEKQEIQDLLAELTEESEKVYSESVSLECATGPVYYVGETALITCEVRNTGNVVLEDLNVCLDECRTIDITIGQSQTLEYDVLLESDGAQDMVVTAKNDQVTKTESVLFSVWDRPRVDILELIYPEHVELSEPFAIEFKIEPRTSSVPQKVRVNLAGTSFEKEWRLQQLEQARKYILNVEGNSLSDINNRFRIMVSYSDMNNRTFSDRKEFSIRIEDPSAKDRAIMLLNKINSQIQYDIVVLGIAVFVAGLVVGMIFRTRRQ
jgi:hypothetical protein